MDEVWRPIPIVDGFYEVSNLGGIRRADNKSIRKTPLNKCGYPVFSARGGLFDPPRNDRKCYPVSVHVCVALAFIPNPNNYPEVNHIDGDKSNNRADNLEWCTHNQNMTHAGKTGLCRGYNHKRVLQIKDGIVINEFSSVSNASKITGVHPSAIGNVANHRISTAGGRYLTAGGYGWEWANG